MYSHTKTSQGKPASNLMLKAARTIASQGDPAQRHEHFKLVTPRGMSSNSPALHHSLDKSQAFGPAVCSPERIRKILGRLRSAIYSKEQ